MGPHNLHELGFENIGFFLEEFKRWEKDPLSVDPTWNKAFKSFENHLDPTIEVSRPSKINSQSNEDLSKVIRLIEGYRQFGHLKAHLSPINNPSQKVEQLEFGFSADDLQKEWPTFGVLEQEKAPLKAIIEKLESIYSKKAAVEFEGIVSPEIEDWIRTRIEKHGFNPPLSIAQKNEMLGYLNKAELFETFLHMRYPGQKRFSLEGCETLIPVLAICLEKGAELGAEEFYLGMAHRGRLNVLCNILQKTYAEVFSEFSDDYVPLDEEGGDVKYHKGFRSEVQTKSKEKVLLHLVDNPSHLESVYPVLLGMTRARQEKLGKIEEVVPIIIHGDAAISGQGVVYETLQFSNLEGYKTGGAIHIVLNNEIGFTTLPEQGRSTRYCTDIARTFNAPVFHVNEEDPEAALFIANLAVELRQKFKIDVFIDLIGYRKYGHNEGDEPFFTQPIQYKAIRQKQSVREYYRDRLIAQGELEKSMAEFLEAEFKTSLQEALKNKNATVSPKKPVNQEIKTVDTSVPIDELIHIAKQLSTFPENLHPHSKILQLYQDRLQMVNGAKSIDWGMAETLAYATLLLNKRHVRISGQDVERGTFSHRQSVIVDQETDARYYPLDHLSGNQAKFDCYNSSLSEYAVLGFEYGYSLEFSDALTIWEAQYGDFSNGGQIIIDQYIAAGEQKWGVRSPLTLMLPHGYEGQGSEHSSARIERYLSLSGKNNMRVVNPTTPAQLFHLLRGHVLSDEKRPLILFTPKGLLRHPKCVSGIAELSSGVFKPLLLDGEEIKNRKVLMFCSGRIYYDLKALKPEAPLIRVEQLYPFPEKEVKQILKLNPEADVVWIQEEPENMGPWWNVQQDFRRSLLPKQQLMYIGRGRSATPAVGSHDLHKKEFDAIVKAFLDKVDG